MKIKELVSKLKPEGIRLEPAQLVLVIYIMLLFSRFVIADIDTGANRYLAIVILQLLTFVIPAALWYRLRGMEKYALDPEKKMRYIDRLRFEPPRARHALIIFAAILALIAGCMLFSINFAGKSSFEGSFTLYDTFAAKKDGTVLGTVGLILAYAVLPAVCEELVFRGILCAEYEGRGVVCSFAFSTVWFALLHFNAEKLVAYLFAGAVLTALLYATRSVFTCIIAHFFYNLFGLFGQQYITEFYITAGSLGVFIFIMIALLLLAAAIFCGQASRLYRRYSEKDAPSDYREPHTKEEVFSALLVSLKTPACAICLVLWLGTVIIMAIL